MTQLKIKGLKKNLTTEDIQMAKKGMKICSPSYVIKEMEIKTAMRYDDAPVRVTEFCTIGQHEMLARMRSNRNSPSLVMVTQRGQPRCRWAVSSKNNLCAYHPTPQSCSTGLAAPRTGPSANCGRWMTTGSPGTGCPGYKRTTRQRCWSRWCLCMWGHGVHGNPSTSLSVFL